jgi:hypothetical protein
MKPSSAVNGEAIGDPKDDKDDKDIKDIKDNGTRFHRLLWLWSLGCPWGRRSPPRYHHGFGVVTHNRNLAAEPKGPVSRNKTMSSAHAEPFFSAADLCL